MPKIALQKVTSSLLGERRENWDKFVSATLEGVTPKVAPMRTIQHFIKKLNKTIDKFDFDHMIVAGDFNFVMIPSSDSVNYRVIKKSVPHLFCLYLTNF